MSFKTYIQLIAPAGLLALDAMAPADAVPLSGTSALGNFPGNLTYSATTNTTATLNVSLTNTSLVANSGFITTRVMPQACES